MGYVLIPLVDEEQAGSRLDRISMTRRRVALELDVVGPMNRVRDNLSLRPNTYAVKLRGIEVGHGELLAHRFLAMNAGSATEQIEGIDTVEPTFGVLAIWIGEAQKQRAELAGYTVVDPPSVLTTQLSELIRRHAPELLSRQDTQTLLTNLKADYPAVVEELVPGVLTVGEVQSVLHELLRERVSIRDLVTICETLADRGRQTKDIDALTDATRQALARRLSMQHGAADGRMRAMTLLRKLEQTLAASLHQTETGPALIVELDLLQRLLSGAGEMERAASRGHEPVLLCSARIRSPLRRLIKRRIAQPARARLRRRAAEDRVRIEVPRRRGDALQARAGASLTLVVQVRGRPDLYTTSVRTAIDRMSEELIVELPTAMPQTERRGWYRVVASLAACSAALVDDKGREIANLMELSLLDLSGGGAQLATRSALAAGDRTRIALRLSGELSSVGDVEITAAIVSAERLDQAGPFTARTPRFVDVQRSAEERIARFVFREQRLMQRMRVA